MEPLFKESCLEIKLLCGIVDNQFTASSSPFTIVKRKLV